MTAPLTGPTPPPGPVSGLTIDTDHDAEVTVLRLHGFLDVSNEPPAPGQIETTHMTHSMELAAILCRKSSTLKDRLRRQRQRPP